MSISKILIVVVFVLVAAVPCFAQKETGAIRGTISDAEGHPLPGATVTATSTSLVGGANVVTTNEKGFYWFPNLPPGTYEVKAEMNGFQTVARQDVRLFVGNTLTLDMSTAQTTSEEIQVVGETPLVDVTTPAMSKTVPNETVENLPKSSFALDLFTLTPGVGDISYVAYGAGGSQANGYWFDGLDISDPRTGSFWVYPNYNWIEEVQVVGLGAPAEYGGFTGVITNTVSKSGTNNYHGLFETFYEGSSFVGNNVDDPALQPNKVDVFSDNTVQLGGPIIKDKLLFFAGAQWYYQKSAPFGYPPDGSGALVKDDQPRAIGKLTYRENQNNTFQGFMEWDRYTRDGRGADAFTLPEATAVDKGPELFWNASWVSILNFNTVLDIRYSGYSTEFNTIPRNGQTPGHVDYTGLFSKNYYRFRLSDRSRNQVNASVSHYAQNFIKGSHDFKFGVEYEHSNANRKEYYPGGMYYYDYYGAPYYRYLWDGYDSQGRIRRVSAYAQDSWHVNDKLNVSLGVRFDHNHSFLAEADRVNYTTNPVAPRLGFTYDLRGDQKTVIKLNYGHYYEKPVTFLIDGIDNFGDRTTQFWNGSDWETTRFRSGASLWTVDQNLKQPYRQQFAFGVEQQLPREIGFSAHYIYANDKDLIDDRDTVGIYEPIPFVNPLTGQTITIYNQLNADVSPQFLITNIDALYRHYHAVEVSANKRFSGKFSLNGSVVWSRNRSNTSNSDNGSDGYTTLFDDPNFNLFIDGRPTYDPTWEIKMQGYYEFPWHILSSFYYRHFTGDTYTTTIRLPGSVIDQGPITIFGEQRGSNRIPSRNVVDFRIEKAFPIATGNLKFTMDVFNLFNTGYVYDLETRFDRANYLQPTSFTDPRVVRLGIRYQF